MESRETDIFQRLLKGEVVSFFDKDYFKISNACDETRKLLVPLNNETDPGSIRELVSEIIATEVDATTTIFPPMQINYGKNITIGKDVFINFNCTLLDLGGIIIEDNVMIAPGVNLLSEGHPLSPNDRQKLTTGKIHIKRNAWIGANATILQGVTIGENSVIAAGAVVSKDVPDNVVVGGIPAVIIKTL